MFRKNKLSYAVAAAVGATIASGAANAAIEEIIVTATKTAQSAQDIPIAVQAMGGDTIDELGIETFSEYVQYLPNVTQQGRGPGQNEIYIRGVATEQSGTTVSSVQGSAPAVALYLDEQPVAFGGRNLDIYAADLERVEVLPGPQGTLFGASSQSGTVRLITRKPDHSAFGGNVRASAGFTKDGEQSTAIQATINVPLSDRLAVRATVYNDNQGGWIDNIAGSFNSNDLELINVINRNQISGSASVINDGTAQLQRATNAGLEEEDWNDASYEGVRLGVAYDFNDDWNLVVQHTAQTLETEGVFEYHPYVANNNQESSQSFSPSQSTDEFGLTTWTLNGRIGTLDLVYTGGFLDREVNQLTDYTLYTFGGGYQVYYICNGYTNATQCFDPVKQYRDQTENERFTNEIRVSTDQDARLRFTGGIFIDDIQTQSFGEFQYPGAVQAGFDVAALGGNGDPSTAPGVRRLGPTGAGVNSIFVNDFTREEDQTAFFGELSFDLTDDITVTAGARRYDIDFALRGSTASSFGCKGDIIPDDGSVAAGTTVPGGIVRQRPDGTYGCDGVPFDNNVTNRLRNLGAAGATPGLGADGVANQSDTIVKFSVDWKPSDAVLWYATYSEGFRPQVTNRNAGVASGNQSGVFAGYVVPAIADTDQMENFEIGFKGDLLNDTLRLNATAYFSEISELQTTRFDPSNIAFLVFIENVGDAEVNGLDLDFQWEVSENFTLFGAAGFVDSEITRLNPQLVGLAAPVGSELPYTGDFSFNLRGRYDFQLSDFGADAWLQAGVVFTGESKAGIIGNANFVEDTTRRLFGRGSGLSIANEGGTFGATRVATEVPGSTGLTADGQFFQNGRYVQDSYTVLNVSAGVAKDNWSAELYIDNLTDERGIVHVSTFDYTPTVSSTRPMTLGLRFSYDFD